MGQVSPPLALLVRLRQAGVGAAVSSMASLRKCPVPGLGRLTPETTMAGAVGGSLKPLRDGGFEAPQLL